MTSKLDIANQALMRAGNEATVIADFENDNSPEAQLVRVAFDQSVNHCLRDVEFPFATKIEALSLIDGGDGLDTDNDDKIGGSPFLFIYDYPNDCVRLIEIINPQLASTFSTARYYAGLYNSRTGYRFNATRFQQSADSPPITNPHLAALPFTIFNVDGNQTIHTNLEEAFGIYISNSIDLSNADTLFIEMLILKLAYDISFALSGSSALKQNLLNDYIRARERARHVAATEQKE